ncbi:MAG: hypothetical protein JNK82_20900 [Myxococcaceae bacterium]|nr:hypothetical protein [Myxococcaceae bacterium]
MEIVYDPVEHCARRSIPQVSASVRLNRRGEVALKFTSTSVSAAVRDCIQTIVQPDVRFTEGEDLMEIGITVPSDRFDGMCEVERREAKPSGEACSIHRDCGAGQACIPASNEATDAGSASPKSRCIDFQRWLRARQR